MSYFSCFLFLFLCPALPWWVNLWVSCLSLPAYLCLSMSCLSLILWWVNLWVSCLSSCLSMGVLFISFLFLSLLLGGKIYGCPAFLLLWVSCFSSCFSFMGVLLFFLLFSIDINSVERLSLFRDGPDKTEGHCTNTSSLRYFFRANYP